MESLNNKMLTAALNGDWATAKKMVVQGADINYTDSSGNFAMFAAAWEGDINAMNMLYDLGAKISFDGANLLCNAAFNGKANAVIWLLQKGEDVNFSFTDTGENALHYTLCKTSEMENRTEIVKMLIKAGIDVNKRTIAGKPTLCFMRDTYLKGEAPLHRAAAYGNVAIVKMLLDAGAEPWMKDINGDTPISWASWHLREADLLRLLVFKGVPGIR